MRFEFTLPDLGEGIAEGEIVKWHVKEGDTVEEHQTLVEVETDKAIVEVPSPKKGRILKIRHREGETVEVGDVLVELEVEEEERAAEEKKESLSVVGTLPQEEEILATPMVRQLARRLGVDLKKLKGTGRGGWITEEDVRRAAEKRERPSTDRYGPIERIPLKGVRKSIAKNLSLSLHTKAFVTGMDMADVTELWELRRREKEEARRRGIRLTFLPFFIKAVQHALGEHPLMNAGVDEESLEVVVKKYYNIGIAVDTPDGLMVPVIRDVAKKSILELAQELEALSERAKKREISLEELKGSSFTISNYGTFGGLFATPIINLPDVAILGTGRIEDRPWVKEGQIVVRKILPLSLTFDHRVVDGSEAAIFLNRVKGYLEDPGLMFIESL